MKLVWVYDRYLELDDDVNLTNLVIQRKKEQREQDNIRKLKRENERLKNELEEKEHILALREKREPNISNNANDISQGTRRSIVKEAKNISSQYALKGFKGISTNKGIKIDWKIK